MSLPSDDSDFWLFGYGSLIWKPPPHYDQRIPGYVEGYVRRFWQASEDHRGTPEFPGRVVTLITESLFLELTSNTQVQARSSKAPTRVWGAAYHIPAEHAAEVKEYLDIREINGYSIEYVAFHPYSPNSTSSAAPVSAPATIRTLLYIGLPSNPQFLGVQSQEAVAQRIAVSVGPSGKNSEYLFNLQAALGSLIGEDVSAVDEHIDDLVKRVRELEKVGVHRRRGSFKKQDSNDSQREEVEEIEVTR